ncbi:uncharacterized protein [Antedon mediterranea]|uniref:uncharacterized protein n=1 Tax=Antedon mediterranea TaxID=105859 RepID=UPI003AF4161E
MERKHLVEALLRNDLKTIKQICKTQPGLLKSINENGNTPLHECLWLGDPTLEIVTCLIQHGAPVALQNKYGDTILHSYLGNRGYTTTIPTLEIVTCLIQHGSPVALQNKNGNTPLHECLWLGDPTLEIVTCLIQHEAPIFI